jgi:hypothetical protein
MRSKLFVGNLNYETTTAKLESAFYSFPGYSHAKVRTDVTARNWPNARVVSSS